MLDNVLTKDHERVDKYLEEFLQSLNLKPNLEKLYLIKESLKNHMFWEEEYLFPEVLNENELRVKGLEAEHGSIIKLLDEISRLISIDELSEAIKKTQAVMRVLKGHNETEEGYMYLELDKLDQEKQASLILQQVKHASAPKDWTCKVLRKNSLR